MFHRWLVATTALLAAGACTAFAAEVPPASAKGPSCATLEGRALALRQTQAQPDLARGTLQFAPGIAPNMIRYVHTDILSGTCAGAVQAFRMGNVFLSDGQAVAVQSTGEFTPRAGVTLREGAITAKQPHPRAAGTFVMGFRVNAGRRDGSVGGDFVGLWREKDRSVVRAFSILPGGRPGAPVTILTSTLPLRSVTYFPAPDSQSGRLGLVQEAPSGEVRLIGLDWSHPGIFE
jgi:hypothetical protein